MHPQPAVPLAVLRKPASQLGGVPMAPKRGERLGVGLEHGVHQPQSNGVKAPRFGLEPRDPADERTRAGIPALGYGGCGHDRMLAHRCQLCVK